MENQVDLQNAVLTISDQLTPSPDPCIVPYEGGLQISNGSTPCTLLFVRKMDCTHTLTLAANETRHIDLNHVRHGFSWEYSIAAQSESTPSGPLTGGHSIQIGNTGEDGK
ncbi:MULTISPECIES: hypothetical protein [Acidobacterium]|uniref:Uncharacterized protein n=1 Tax=Acidobacterium capsulatum (strain ATCC 51196 / DSM 11244 / BCRC 80197 / JCM 7670 / NBRC 15755 / NCIMB 13165 / 161) TaxID=240015 RepID=C1F8Q6_ACIC5|nr:MULTISPECIES: hypothetical protein [Acidobacterium]ACO32986.1 hypothetical protein ACP_0185 [Acidobacterium capsulatum ATCC 51196]HCT61558.1 hypothetical protein [Acidobacterium sp.]